ncbi:MAG: hypothetical protein V4695_00295 [Pseudomonadota bacterium]
MATVAYTNASKLQPAMSDNALAAIDQNFGEFKKHISDEDHCSVHNQVMLALAKKCLTISRVCWRMIKFHCSYRNFASGPRQFRGITPTYFTGEPEFPI